MEHQTCRNGHPRNEENTGYKERDGRIDRYCRVCKRNCNRRSRKSKLADTDPTMTPHEKLEYARRFMMEKVCSRPTASAENLWHVYQAQSNVFGNPKKPTCRYGHPRTKANTSCRWTKSPNGVRFVRADCRLCGAYNTRQSARRKSNGTDILDLLLWRPEPTHPKDIERQRINRAMDQWRQSAC